MKTATTATAATVSRRAWLSRLLLAAAVAPVLGVRLADTADAGKKGKKKAKSIKERAEGFRKGCVEGGGNAEVTKRPGGTTVACTGSGGGDWTCTVLSKGERCHWTLTNPPKTPVDDVHTPPTGGTEDPTDGGGNDTGGGAHVPPSGGVDSGGGTDPVLT